jgi:hypothetical protein
MKLATAGLFYLVLLSLALPAQAGEVSTFNFLTDQTLLPNETAFSYGVNNISGNSVTLGGYVFASKHWSYWKDGSTGGLRNADPTPTSLGTLNISRADGKTFDLNSFTFNLGGSLLPDMVFDVVGCLDLACNTTVTNTYAPQGITRPRSVPRPTC